MVCERVAGSLSREGYVAGEVCPVLMLAYAACAEKCDESYTPEDYARDFAQYVCARVDRCPGYGSSELAQLSTDACLESVRESELAALAYDDENCEGDFQTCVAWDCARQFVDLAETCDGERPGECDAVYGTECYDTVAD